MNAMPMIGIFCIALGVLNFFVLTKVFQSFQKGYGAKPEDLKLGDLIFQITGVVFMIAGLFLFFRS